MPGKTLVQFVFLPARFGTNAIAVCLRKPALVSFSLVPTSPSSASILRPGESAAGVPRYGVERWKIGVSYESLDTAGQVSGPTCSLLHDWCSVRSSKMGSKELRPGS